MKRIGIIGASGYIGQHLMQTLAQTFSVTALQRNIHTIMPKPANVNIADIEDTTATFDMIINTSYNLNKDLNTVYAQNENVLQNIQRLSHADTQVIHLSSLAVFGFGLDKPIELKPVKLSHDYAYTMSKVHMEQCLLNAIPHEQLSIIRLGNVWGPENNSWTQPVADALQWGLPVLSKKHTYSNITYIEHIGEYITFLIGQSNHQLIHHLAEFSFISWQQIIGEMSNRLGVTPASINHVPFYAKSLADDIRNSLQLHPKTALKNFRDGRFSSMYFPTSLIQQLQAFIQHNTQKNAFRPSAYHPDPTFYWILTCDTEFKTQTLPGWKPRYAWKDVEMKVANWLQEAGLITEKR